MREKATNQRPHELYEISRLVIGRKSTGCKDDLAVQEYLDHVKVDADGKLILDYEATPANVHDIN